MSIDDAPSFSERLAAIERRLERMELSRRLPSASIGEGGLSVLDGGKIEVVDGAGDVLAVLDGSGVRLFDAGGATVAAFDADGFVRLGADTTSASDVIDTSSYDDALSVTFTPPAGWGDYRIVAQGAAQIRPGNINNNMQTRLRIGGSDGPAINHGTYGVVAFSTFVGHSADGLSGSATVAIQTKRSDSLANPDPSIEWQQVSYTAIRTS